MPNRKATVIVTGSNGFVGSALVDRLSEKYDVVAMDRSHPSNPPVHAECISMDVTSEESVASAFSRFRAAHGGSIASVIHLAAYFDVSGEPDPLYEQVTVDGTTRLLKALKDFDVGQLVFLSTMLVHAPSGHGHRIDEDSPLDDRFPYRASKIRTEKLLREQHDNIPLVLLRPAGVYTDLCQNTFLAHQLARIYEKRLTAYVYPGDLQAGQPFLHLDDLVNAVMRVVDMRQSLALDTALLLAENGVMAFGDIQKTAAQLMHGEDWETWTIPKPVASTGAWVQANVLDEDPFIRPYMVQISSDHYNVDSSRARKLLQWRPRHSLNRAMPKMVEALERDPVSWYRSNKLNAARVAAEGAARERTNREDDDGVLRDGGKHHGGEMARHMRDDHFQLLWVHWLNMLLGAWLLSSPFALGLFGQTEFTDAVLRVTAERGLADPAWRNAMLGTNDLICGALIMLFSGLSLSPRFSLAQWGNAAVGCWLLLAPLVFWAPGAAAYANDTFVGALVIAFAILVPMMPGMAMDGMMDPSDLPPGWSYCPSTYLQRLPIIALGAFGFLIARTLAAYQLGHIDGVWEPFFAGSAVQNGTEQIITSSVSKAWPVADGGLGAVAYLFEILMGVMGSHKRWRTMPWMVAMFGIVVVPLGIVSIYFIVIQPIVIGTWCTLCLITAMAMLVMIPYSVDELVAMGQYLVQSKRRGEPFWRTFFKGGAQPGQGQDSHAGFDGPIRQSIASAVRGVNLPWTLVVSAVLGAFLMFTRLYFGTVPPMADSDHLVGALIVTFAVIAMAEVARPLRFANVMCGLWLVVAPWQLTGATPFASWVSVAIGVAIVLLSLSRGKRSAEHYGDWDRYVV